MLFIALTIKSVQAAEIQLLMQEMESVNLKISAEVVNEEYKRNRRCKNIVRGSETQGKWLNFGIS